MAENWGKTPDFVRACVGSRVGGALCPDVTGIERASSGHKAPPTFRSHASPGALGAPAAPRLAWRARLRKFAGHEAIVRVSAAPAPGVVAPGRGRDLPAVEPVRLRRRPAQGIRRVERYRPRRARLVCLARRGSRAAR